VVDVLVLGDANPDLVLRGDVVPRFGQAEQLLSAADLVTGGSGAIVAHGLARLGRSVGLAAVVGADPLGDLVVRLLRTAGIDLASITRSRTATAMTVVLTRGDDRAVLTFAGAIPELTGALARSALDRAVRDGVRHLHVSSLFLLPRLAADLAGVLAHARSQGVSTSLDTNFDPAERWEGVEELLPHLDLLLPNRAEVVALAASVAAPGPSEPADAAAALASRGPVVVVKAGADGAFRTDPDGTVHHEPGQRVSPVDTTGAGDSFDAAYIDALLTGLGPASCLRRATTAGALSTSTVGGTAAQPTTDQLQNHERERDAPRH
jgi:ribokinase